MKNILKSLWRRMAKHKASPRAATKTGPKKAPKLCSVCHRPLFTAKPFETTQQEIVEFTQNSSLRAGQKETIIQEGWIHPGVYCPNGCTTMLIEYGPPKLPGMTIEEAIAIGRAFSQAHHKEFLETQGENSRIAACVHCGKFGGAIIEGESQTARYWNPKLTPLRNRKIVSAHCGDPRIEKLPGAWWYDKGNEQPQCPYFEYGRLFHWTYKSVTGWSEYAKSR